MSTVEMAVETKKRRLTQSQLDAILALPEHEHAQAPTSESRVPAYFYTDPEHFKLEQSKLFRRMPIPLTLSAMLPKPNMAFAHDGFGIPILLTRDREGQVKAFLNACGHRGAKLIEGNEPTTCARMSCPYHAWTYDLGGNLIGVPRAEVFPTLDRSTRGLRRLPVCEAGGIIWVGLDPAAQIDFTDTKGPLAADLDAFGIPGMHVYGRKSFDIQGNWKILVETFLETYHVPPLHKNTVAPHFAEVPTILTWMGPHNRQTVGRSHFTRESLDIDVDEVHKIITHAYHLFPGTILVTSPYHINFITMMPRAVDRTIAECYLLTKAPPDSPKAEDLYARSLEFNFTTVFRNEDFRAAELVQTGLSSGALEDVYFGGLEYALADFHRNIAGYMAD